MYIHSHCQLVNGYKVFPHGVGDWAGCVRDFSESGRRKLASTIEIFDPYLETWEKHHTTGVPHPGLYGGACTSLLDSLTGLLGTMAGLITIPFIAWTPQHWRGLQDKLATFGSYVICTNPSQLQPGAKFVSKNTKYQQVQAESMTQQQGIKTASVAVVIACTQYFQYHSSVHEVFYEAVNRTVECDFHSTANVVFMMTIWNIYSNH